MKLAIWGTGSAAKTFLDKLDAKHEIVTIVDNDQSRHGTLFYGVFVQSPIVLKKNDYDVLIIASNYYREIKKQISSDDLCHFSKLYSLKENIAHCSQLTTTPHHSCKCPPEMIEKIDDRRWFHAIELVPGCYSPGDCFPDLHFIEYPQTQDLTNKKVLDIGAWDGGYTFMAEKRGGQVTAYDIQDPNHSGFNIAKAYLGSKARHIMGSVYDLSPDQHGIYDVVYYFGVFYHLFDPVRAFCNINRVLDNGGLMLFEGAILDFAYNVDKAWIPLKHEMAPYTSVPLTYYTSKDYWNDWSTWFVPNLKCLQEWIISAGFEVLEIKTIEATSRGYGLAKKTGVPMPEHELL